MLNSQPHWPHCVKHTGGERGTGRARQCCGNTEEGKFIPGTSAGKEHRQKLRTCTLVFGTKKKWQANFSCVCVFCYIFHYIQKQQGGRRLKKRKGFCHHPMLRVPLCFVCETLEVLHHWGLLRVRGGGPASGGRGATQTRLVTQAEAATADGAPRCHTSRQRSDETEGPTTRAQRAVFVAP